MAQEVKNLYVHVPFCDGKCRYCAFYSVVPSPGDIAAYPALPAKEATLRGFGGISPTTVYFGGGTPGLLGSDGFTALVSSLKKAGIDFSSAEEWTVELNPSTITPEIVGTLRMAGVTRISLGVQSFNDETLRRIGRRHSAEDALNAVAIVRGASFEDVGIDLIAGLPDVSQSEWSRTLDTALSLELKHISVYSLILEAGTPMSGDVACGKFAMPSTDEVMDTLLATEDRLSVAGFERYEISNYGKPGYFCQHNLAVWHGEDYLGLGPAASSRTGLVRRTNANSLDGYVDAIRAGKLPDAECESLAPEEDAVERFVFALRLNEGLSPVDFAARFPAARPFVEKWSRTLDSLVKNGIVERLTDKRWRLTRRGREVADSVAELMEI